ncbi:MAG: glycosyltransferase family 2 protein [Nocardioides sp.]
MLVSVSTLKDRPDQALLFVRRNLHNGIDHMFVFLDAAQPEVAEVLRAEPHVTVIEAHGESWWGDKRPSQLNLRQHTNANVLKAVISGLEGVTWMFHLDADEVIHLDRPRLEGLDRSVSIVHLETLEVATGEWVPGAPALYKRGLNNNQLALLHTLGVILEPVNTVYFHGHTGGKSGFRPTLALYTGIHKPRDERDEVPEGHTADWLRVLHHEGAGFHAFERKWRNLLTSGPRPKFRRTRNQTASAFLAILNAGFPPEKEEHYLREIYRRRAEDDTELLNDLGLLVSVNPDERRYEPRGIPPAALATVERRLAGAAEQDKLIYRTGPTKAVNRLLAQLESGRSRFRLRP